MPIFGNSIGEDFGVNKSAEVKSNLSKETMDIIKEDPKKEKFKANADKLKQIDDEFSSGLLKGGEDVANFIKGTLRK